MNEFDLLEKPDADFTKEDLRSLWLAAEAYDNLEHSWTHFHPNAFSVKNDFALKCKSVAESMRA